MTCESYCSVTSRVLIIAVSLYLLVVHMCTAISFPIPREQSVLPRMPSMWEQSVLPRKSFWLACMQELCSGIGTAWWSVVHGHVDPSFPESQLWCKFAAFMNAAFMNKLQCPMSKSQCFWHVFFWCDCVSVTGNEWSSKECDSVICFSDVIASETRNEWMWFWHVLFWCDCVYVTRNEWMWFWHVFFNFVIPEASHGWWWAHRHRGFGHCLPGVSWSCSLVGYLGNDLLREGIMLSQQNQNRGKQCAFALISLLCCVPVCSTLLLCL